MYNPDGKEIIARDNEVSILRREDIGKAYLGCHTDITIPYDELDEICGVTSEDGRRHPIIIRDRKFLSGNRRIEWTFLRIM